MISTPESILAAGKYLFNKNRFTRVEVDSVLINIFLEQFEWRIYGINESDKEIIDTIQSKRNKKTIESWKAKDRLFRIEHRIKADVAHIKPEEYIYKVTDYDNWNKI
jgi:hypothetical protein